MGQKNLVRELRGKKQGNTKLIKIPTTLGVRFNIYLASFPRYFQHQLLLQKKKNQQPWKMIAGENHSWNFY